jgi:DNA-binding response OmpR family regulator
LLDRVWGEDYPGTGAVLKATVRRVRQKLLQAGATRPYVRTVRERGYTFDARATPRSAQERDPGGPPRVLIVDDDPATVALIRAAVEEEGYAVTHSVGVDVVALARRFRPAVVLLDINVPGNAGAVVRRRLRDDPHTAGIPVIALAASRTLRLHAHEIQANDYLAKPFDADELLLCIGRWAVPPARALSSPVAEPRQETERLLMVVPGR